MKNLFGIRLYIYTYSATVSIYLLLGDSPTDSITMQTASSSDSLFRLEHLGV